MCVLSRKIKVLLRKIWGKRIEIDGFIVLQSSRKRSTSAPPALRQRGSEASEVLKYFSQSRLYTSQSIGKSGSSFPGQPTRIVPHTIMQPEFERGATPFYMRRETYTNQPVSGASSLAVPHSIDSSDSFNFKRTALVGGGVLLALSPFAWGPLAFAAMSTYLFSLTLGATELVAGVAIKSGISADSSSANSAAEKDKAA